MAAESIDVFSFMALRGCERLDAAASRQRFIRDDAFHLHSQGGDGGMRSVGVRGPLADLPTGLHDVDLFSAQSLSPIGRNLWNDILAGLDVSGVISRVESQLLAGLEYPTQNGPVRLAPLLLEVNVTQALQPAAAIRLATLTQRMHYRRGPTIRILPDALTDIRSARTTELDLAWTVALNQMARATSETAFALERFLAELARALDLPAGDAPLTDWVFDRTQGSYSVGFTLAKRVFFDALYGLFVLRKRERVNLEPAIVGLRALHFLELLAMAEFYLALEGGGAASAFAAASTPLRTVLGVVHPLAQGWRPGSGDFGGQMRAAAIAVPASWTELRELARATPVVSPVFARFSSGFMPFNSITPVGIGDLKVVKQTFLGYRKGEIAHIETVLAGEEKTREHRALEKTEEAVTLASSTENENTRDSQSTDRFELKREAEEIIKNDINANANTTVTYNGTMVVASVTAGFSFANSRTDTRRQASNLVNEVINKATTRIVARTSETRSRTTLFETEEKNIHSFKNLAPNGNISGMYRWLDKIYQGQIHNFGKRMMFEFILPEPAAFYVQSKLYAYAASLDLPDYPQGIPTGPKKPPMPVASPSEITEELYRDVLTKQYRLGDLPPPAAEVQLPVRDGSSSTHLLKKYPFKAAGYLNEDYSVTRPAAPAGYELTDLSITGTLKFFNRDEPLPDLFNSMRVEIGGTLLFEDVNEKAMNWEYADRRESLRGFNPSTTFRLDLLTRTCIEHDLQFAFVARPSAAAFGAWQQSVYDRMLNAPPPEPTGPPEVDQRITAYEEALKKIEPRALNDIITGSSPDANSRMVRNELKRQCISVIAKEYDTASADDLISRVDAVGQVPVGGQAPQLPGIDFPSFAMVRGVEGKAATIARFVDKPDGPYNFAAINLFNAERKGRFVQFLEQAFEWEHLSQVYYPYFWAALPNWVALMSREDISDPQFTEFLRAGSARVLLAVRPGYENAVLHFLATREPWEGGPSPVIGDPLYVPLYDEIREEQDSFAGSVPDGEPWTFALPTSLIYLESENYPLVNEYRELMV